ncbi:MAG: hypothetical protein M3Y12_13975 [Bacteroidota bacterium]|nr:hypothetical protein [Bacteroidota bacterium]
MRTFLLAVGLLLPTLGRAQLFSRFEPGSYVLNDSRNVRQPGQLKLQGSAKLLLKQADGKTVRLQPEQVHSFRISTRQYVSVGNFHVRGGLGGADIERGFAEQLDSGQVVLLRYTYSVGAGAPMMGAGGGMSYGGSSEFSAYLLSWPGEPAVTPVQGSLYTGGGKQFREAVRPFLFSRPDLEKLLDDKLIGDDNLPAVIHALNRSLPYVLPAPVPATN